MSHAVQQENGELKAKDSRYDAVFNKDGFTIGTKPPQSDGKTTMGAQGEFRTLSVKLGSDELFSTASGRENWSVLGNTVQRMLNVDKGIIEHYEARSEGVEVTWVLREQVKTEGNLQIEAELKGLSLVGSDDLGLLFGDADTGNASLRVGKVVMVDGAGARNELPMIAENGRMRVSVAGTLLASATYPVAIDPIVSPTFPVAYTLHSSNQVFPAIAANSTNFFVVWQDQRNPEPHIYGTRVNQNGEILDLNGIAICTAVNGQGFPQVASAGNDFLVVWLDERTGDDYLHVFGTIVTSSGSVGSDFPICDDGRDQQWVDVAASSTGYLVTYEDDYPGYRILANRVTVTGTVLDGDGFVVNTAASPSSIHWLPTAASDGNDFLVAWEEFPSGDIFARPVSAAGAIGAQLTIAEDSSQVQLAWSAATTNFIAVYSHSGGVSANRLTAVGAPLDGSVGFVVTNSGFYPDVACASTNLFIVWKHQPFDGYGTVYGARLIPETAVVTDRITVSIQGQLGYARASVAILNTNIFCVWDQTSSDLDDEEFGDIIGARIPIPVVESWIVPVSTDGVIPPLKFIAWSSTSTGFLYSVSGGRGGDSAEVQASTDFVTWTSIATYTCGSTNYTNIDTAAATAPYRFYRAKTATQQSQNAFGYNRIVCPPGYKMIANQFCSTGGNSLSNLLPIVPEGTTIQKWVPGSPGGFLINTFDFDEWADPSETLNPGEGAFINNVTTGPLTIVFCGEVPQGILTLSVPQGQSIVSSMVPQAGELVQDLAFPFDPLQTTTIQRWSGTGYLNYDWDVEFEEWNAVPSVGVGESFWATLPSARTWTRTFSVW
ncbi:MAG TPA: hypothetical protein VK530_21395 [Candidatus Acidoferrum sp.]|nr:hypothetical protein [Candidatus Acidoferrum sp.]